mgnify:FL=1
MGLVSRPSRSRLGLADVPTPQARFPSSYLRADVDIKSPTSFHRTFGIECVSSEALFDETTRLTHRREQEDHDDPSSECERVQGLIEHRNNIARVLKKRIMKVKL